MRLITMLGALLLLATPAHALPVQLPSFGAAILHADGCGWSAPLANTRHVAPPCGGLEVTIVLPAGDPTSLWSTLAYYPTGFASLHAEGVSQDRRMTTGGRERFPIAPPVDGDYFFALAIASPVRNEAYFYDFTFTLPTTGGGGGPVDGGAPLNETPEPATQLLMGASLAAVGVAARKRRGR